MSTGARVALEVFPAPARRALERLSALLGAAPGWLVGGALRDALLGDAVGEVDIAVTAGGGAPGEGRAPARPAPGLVPRAGQRGVCPRVSDVPADAARLT